MTRIVGMDVGYRHTGLVAVSNRKVVAAACIHTKKADKKLKIRSADDDCRCLSELRAGILGFIAEHDPACIAIEMPSGGSKSSTAMRAMAFAKAVAVCVVDELRLPAVYLTPGECKQALLGKQQGSKEAVEAAVLKSLPSLKKYLPDLVKSREHIADAAAAYIAAEDDPVVRMAERRTA